jgi:hypothetical protein
LVQVRSPEAAPEMRPLIDMRFKPHLWARRSFGLEVTSAHYEAHEIHKESGAGASVQSGEVRRIAQ